MSGLNAENFRALARNLGESYRWLKAFRADNYDPSDNTYNRGAAPASEKGRVYVEQTLDSAVRCVVSHTKIDTVDESFGDIPMGETMISVMPDESQLARFDKIILPSRKLVNRSVMTRAGSGDYDTLPELNAVEITDVRQGDTVYVVGTDFALNADRIQWLTGSRPVAASKYSIEFTYNPVFTFLGDEQGERLARPDENGVLMPMRGIITLRSVQN